MATREELEAQLKELDRAEREAREQKHKRAVIAYSALPLEWKCTPVEWVDWATKKKYPGVRVQCRKELVAYAGYIAEFGDHSDRNEWKGMTYYRTEENILTSNSGGSCVLNEPKLCNDEEWAAILAGNIPEKYRKGW